MSMETRARAKNKRQRRGDNDECGSQSYNDQYFEGGDEQFYDDDGGDYNEEHEQDATDRRSRVTNGKEEEQEREAPVKYWVQRYMLFSLFDKGIRMDRGELFD